MTLPTRSARPIWIAMGITAIGFSAPGVTADDVIRANPVWALEIRGWPPSDSTLVLTENGFVSNQASSFPFRHLPLTQENRYASPRDTSQSLRPGMGFFAKRVGWVLDLDSAGGIEAISGPFSPTSMCGGYENDLWVVIEDGETEKVRSPMIHVMTADSLGAPVQKDARLRCSPGQTYVAIHSNHRWRVRHHYEAWWEPPVALHDVFLHDDADRIVGASVGIRASAIVMDSRGNLVFECLTNDHLHGLGPHARLFADRLEYNIQASKEQHLYALLLEAPRIDRLPSLQSGRRWYTSNGQVFVEAYWGEYSERTTLTAYDNRSVHSPTILWQETLRGWVNHVAINPSATLFACTVATIERDSTYALVFDRGGQRRAEVARGRNPADQAVICFVGDRWLLDGVAWEHLGSTRALALYDLGAQTLGSVPGSARSLRKKP